MNVMQTSHYKEVLEKELKTLEAELKTVGRVNPSNPNDWEAVPSNLDIQEADENETADKIESYEENTAILKQLETRFNEVKDALKRIDGGTYGICKVCNMEIEEKRLEANPAATTCIAHKNE
jgi:RNA polymerase-binding transcription factor DksA